MRTVCLTLAYDGTDFEGWQLQRAGRTVQGVIEAGLLRLSGVALRPVAAGRTDSGVHAAGQVISLRLPPEVQLPLKAFVHGLNRLLPPDVAVLSAQDVPEGFNARKAARSKRYRYLLLNRGTRHPLARRTHWVVFPRLEIDPMRQAAALVVGEHDFAAFRAADCQARTTVRRLHRVELEASGDGEIRFELEGTGFLKHMVRNLVGTLVQVGRRQRDPAELLQLLAERDRRRSGPTAPPQGLTLVSVEHQFSSLAPAGPSIFPS